MRHREIFYTEPANISSPSLEIKGDDFKHLVRVMRKQERDVIHAVDGQGNFYTAVISKIGKQSAYCEIQKRARFVGEPNFHLTLAQAIPKGNRFDWVIEKGTEIGVSTFIPLLCENSVSEGAPSRISRWRKIAIAAMKQSARSVLPEITSAQTIHDVVRKTGLMQVGFIAEGGDGAKNLSPIVSQIQTKLHQSKSAIILIGPEGGFSNTEIQLAIGSGYHRFSLGPRRLRSETAGIIASAILMELLGELS